jgi:hypothetical protein
MAKKVPRNQEIPVTNQMFAEFRDDVKNLITSKFLEQQALLKTEFLRIDVRLGAIEIRLDKVESEIHDLKSDIHQVKLLTETQTQQNQISLDACRHVMEEMVVLRQRMDKAET